MLTPRTIQRFEVSLKAFILRDSQALFVRESDTGCWELPGGRIDVGEEWMPHAEVLAREMREELGPAFTIAFTPHVVTWIRQRPTDDAFLFLAARVGRAVRGEPVLSAEHDQLGWLDLAGARRLRFPERSGYPGRALSWRRRELHEQDCRKNKCGAEHAERRQAVARKGVTAECRKQRLRRDNDGRFRR